MSAADYSWGSGDILAQLRTAQAALSRVAKLADEWEARTDAVAITYQDADMRHKVTAGQRRNIADLRAALGGDR